MSLTRQTLPAKASFAKAYATARIAGAVLSIVMLSAVNAMAVPKGYETLTRSVDVNGSVSQVWGRIGGFCAIKDWHPAIGSCTEDGKAPPTRTLVTKDGAATFVELQTARSKRQHSYSYTFTSAPIPVTHYSSTLHVIAKGKDKSTITWTGSYLPDTGKSKDAMDALAGIYESGLNAIKEQIDKP